MLAKLSNQGRRALAKEMTKNPLATPAQIQRSWDEKLPLQLCMNDDETKIQVCGLRSEQLKQEETRYVYNTSQYL